jgi:hypothetical protein
MMHPVNIVRFIALSSDDQLDTKVVKDWYKCVCDNAPSGVTISVPNVDNSGNPKTVSLVHRETEGSHHYIVPLTRDLNENEAEKIINAWESEHPDMEFDIRVSASMPDRLDQQHPMVTVEQDRYLAMCTQWAKRQHEEWFKDRADNGWRYGPTFSISTKMHPLLMPWEQLPDKYKKIDLESPQKLLDLLNDQGYAVISKGELEAIMKLMRNFV